MKTNARILLLGVITACLSILGVARAQTVLWSDNFDDGNGNNRWYADNGVWQIGTPTIGPGSAHSAPYRAATGLTANYPAGQSSRLIRIQSFTVPATNQFPRLRFWHWYSFGGLCASDYGVVEVKGTNGIWQAVSPQYAGGSGGWTYASVDLSAYAGQSVQLAFHFVYQECNGATGPGWYVDDIALETGAPVFNNPEGWENGIGDWYAETGTWQVGQPTKAGGPTTNSLGSQAHSGTNCAVTILNANYPANSSRLISPPIQIPAANQFPRLRFWHWYSFGGLCASDYGVVEIRSGTNAWVPLSADYTGNSGSWVYPYLDLTAYGGQSVQLAFHFVYQECNGATDPGWYVDDIGIYSSKGPVIISPPASQANAVGTTATFNVSASGDLPLSYQWRFNLNPITGATNTMLSLANLQLTNTGYYDVVVTNDAGSITSTPPALLSVVINLTGVVVNDPGDTGNFTNANGTYTVQGSGEGTDGTADIFYFAYQTLTGDAQIVARLQSLQGGDQHLAEAGIMIRETLDPGSKQVSLSVNESTNVIFSRRLATNNFNIQNSNRGTNYLEGPNYIWLRLMRMGNTFVAHYSTNGLNWQYMWFTTLNMSNQVQVGLAVTAHHYQEIATATFDNFSIGSLTPLSGAWPLPGPKILLGGQGWSPAELQRVGGFEFLLGGVVGEYDNIIASTNIASSFANWPTNLTVTNTYGVVPILDKGALTNKMKFYRAQKIGP